MRRVILILISIVFFAGCTTISVLPISGVSPSKPGIVYALPKHEFDVVVNYEKTVTSGSAYLDSNKITKEQMRTALREVGLRLPFVKLDATKVTHKINAIQVQTRVVPDPDEFYFVETRQHNHPFLKKVFLFELTKQGYLSQANASGEDYTLDFVLGTVVTAVEVVAGFTNLTSTGGSEDVSVKSNTVDSEQQNTTPLTGNLLELYQLLIRYKELEEHKWEIYQGNVSLTNLGEAPDVSYIIKKIEEEQKAIASLFLGSKKTTSAKKVFSADPQEGTSTIFKFDKDNGFDSEICYELNITKFDTGDLSTFLTGALTKRNKGLHYSIPATALVEVKKGKESFYRAQHVIPQLGETSFLPARVGLTKNDIKYTLDPNTGALLKFDANGEGINLEAVKTFQDAATELPALFEKSEENEFEELEKQIKQLELENLLLEQQMKNDSLSNAGSASGQ